MNQDQPWQKITIHCPPESCETIAAFVTDQTGGGIELTDAPGDITIIRAYLKAGDPAAPKVIRAIQGLLKKLSDDLSENKRPYLELELIQNEDWQRKWKESFKTFHLTANLVVKPSWEEINHTPPEKVIEIDPGMAFGTGLHASTKLAAGLMEGHLGDSERPPSHTLDVGTGTGILAIAAALLGCEAVTAIDNDPQAVLTAVQNIKANSLNDIIRTSATPLAELSGPYEMIIANIIHNTLVEMAAPLASLLAPRGILILAGILAGEQSDNITRVYTTAGLTQIDSLISGEWTALSFKRS